jgi:hypothetical protein
MELQLIEGVFNRNELMDIISRMIDVKINYHVDKIEKSADEDDIKMRERKIRQLQETMHTCRHTLKNQDDVQVSARILIDA